MSAKESCTYFLRADGAVDRTYNGKTIQTTINPPPGQKCVGAPASSPGQLEQNVGALDRISFDEDELALIDQHAVDSGIDLWRGARLG